MAVAITSQIRVDKNHQFVRGLSQHKAGFQLECCVWCMTEQRHDNGTALKVIEGASTDYYAVVWDEKSINLNEVRSSIDLIEAVEYGAEAIALALSILRTDYKVIKKARNRGGGFDYWIGNDTGGLFQEFLRLEISGIFEQSISNTVKTRVKTKLRQLSQSDGTIPGFVIVVEFHEFIGHMEWKNERR